MIGLTKGKNSIGIFSSEYDSPVSPSVTKKSPSDVEGTSQEVAV